MSQTIAAGALAWGALLAFLAAMVAVDLKVGSARRQMTVRTAAVWSGIWITLAVAFGAGLWLAEGAGAGEAYFAVEGANGELGFYVVSDGTERPYRVHCRPPCLPPVAALPRMVEGQMIADIIPTFGSVNMIGGELDR